MEVTWGSKWVRREWQINEPFFYKLYKYIWPCEHRLPPLPSLRKGWTSELRLHQPTGKSALSFHDGEAWAFSEQCGHLLLSQPKAWAGSPTASFPRGLLQLTVICLVHIYPTCSAVKKDIVVNQRHVERGDSPLLWMYQKTEDKERGWKTRFKVKCDMLCSISCLRTWLKFSTIPISVSAEGTWNGLNSVCTDSQGKAYPRSSSGECKAVFTLLTAKWG